MEHEDAQEEAEIGNMVYVKAVAIDDLPASMQDEARVHADGKEMLYAVHDEDGAQLALVSDRKMAYVLARQNDYAPVSLH